MSETEGEPPKGDEPVAPSTEPVQGMTEQQIRDAGLTIDVPFESGAGRTAPIRYADDAEEKKDSEE